MELSLKTCDSVKAIFVGRDLLKEQVNQFNAEYLKNIKVRSLLTLVFVDWEHIFKHDIRCDEEPTHETSPSLSLHGGNVTQILGWKQLRHF